MKFDLIKNWLMLIAMMMMIHYILSQIDLIIEQEQLKRREQVRAQHQTPTIWIVRETLEQSHVPTMVSDKQQ